MRNILFVLACIPSRVLLLTISSYLDEKKLRYYSYIILLIGLSFLYLYFGNKRLNALEGGGETWWHNYRLIHGILFISSFIYINQNKKDMAKIPLMLDVLFSIILFISKNYFKIV